jgi:M6 family metalloprotease-like protein
MTSSKCSVIALGTLCLALAASAAAPPNNSNKTSERPNVFIPKAGYFQQTRNAFENQQVAETFRLKTSAPLITSPNKATRYLPVLLFDFKGLSGSYPRRSYEIRLFGDPADEGTETEHNRRSMTSFYRDMSYRGVSEEVFKIDGEVSGWYHLPNDIYYYRAKTPDGSWPHMVEAIETVLTEADKTIEFGKYDNDGPDGVSNSGDDDGVVDTLILIHSDVPAENSETGLLRSHSNNLSKLTKNGGRQYVTNDCKKTSKGVPIPGTFIKIDDYVLVPGASKLLSPAKKNAISEIGVFCHEFGHALGLPDLYDRTPSSPNSWGIGAYCTMSWGMYGVDRETPGRPVSLSAWCKYFLGWAKADTLSKNGLVTIEPVEKQNQIYRVDIPGTSRQEYFLIEYRAKWWKDGTRINWDEDLPISGLLVWHVDEGVGGGYRAPTWPFTDWDLGQNDTPSTPNLTAGSAPGGMPQPPHLEFKPAPQHALVALIQADGALELEDRDQFAAKFMDAADFFKSGDNLDDRDPTLRRCLKGYNGKPTGIAIRNVNLPPGGPFGYFDLTLQAGAGDFGPMTTQEAEERKTLADLDDWLIANKDKPEPPSVLRVRLATVEEYRIDDGVHPQNRDAVHRLAARARTRTVKRGDAAGTTVERLVQELLVEHQGAGLITARLTPKMTRVEELRGLRIPIGARTPRDDAKTRVASLPLAALLGDRVTIQINPTDSEPQQARQRFDQWIDVKGQSYPIFGRGEGGNLDFAGVYLFYDPAGGFLTKIQNGTFPPDTLLAALESVVSVTPAAARRFADKNSSFLANTPDDHVMVTLGVLVRRDLEKGARFIYAVTYRPEGETPLEVYLDAVTGDPIKTDAS